MKGWKATLRKQKTTKVHERMAVTASSSVSLDPATSFIASFKLREDMEDIMNWAVDNTATELEMESVAVAIATLVMYRSWSRPGAVCNCLLDEYTRTSFEGNKAIIRVVHHKTEGTQPVTLTLLQNDERLLQWYVESVRPQLVSMECSPPYLFVRSGGERISNLRCQVGWQLSMGDPCYVYWNQEGWCHAPSPNL